MRRGRRCIAGVLATLWLTLCEAALAQAEPDTPPEPDTTTDAGTDAAARPPTEAQQDTAPASNDVGTADASMTEAAPASEGASAASPAAAMTTTTATSEADADPSEEPAVSNADTGLGEIVVTAQRRSTNLQQTPISITALTAEALRERSTSDLSGVAEATPNVQLITSSQASGGSNFAQLFIRGVGQTDFYITKDPAVGIYVDGVYLARAPGALLQLLDIERIEVLRGPQGTLFGKNTAGGALNIITKKPEGALSGVAELQGGNYARRSIAGSFETPLIENRLFVRATGLSQHQDGYYERLRAAPIDARTANGNSIDGHAGRVSLRWTPTDDVEVQLNADGTLQRQTGTDYQAIGIFDNAPNIALYNQVVLAPRGAELYDRRFIAPRPWTTYSTTPSYNNTDVWGVSGTLSWDLGPLQLKSISAYRTLRAAARTDADGTPFDIVASNGIVIEQRQLSQELQLTGNAFERHFAWVIGLWYFQEDARDRQSSRQLVGLFEGLEAAPPDSITPPGQAGDMCPADGSVPNTCLGGTGNPNNARYDLTRDFTRRLKGRSYAAFGQGSLKLTDALSVTAGARISREEKAFTFNETQPLQGGHSSFGELRVTPAWNVFTPRLGAEYRFTPTFMGYASYAWGFKAGGITGRPTRAELFKAFDPEWLITYEVGAKSEWFERRVRLNVAAFYSQYRDIQITRNTTDAQGMFVRVEQNAGGGTIKGLEAEATVAPTRQLTIAAALGYTDFKFTSLLPQQGQPGMLLTLDSKLPFTPKLSATLSATYRIDLGSAGQISTHFGADYSSGYYVDIPNTSAIAQRRYWLLNARVAYAPKAATWEAYLAATNITNQAVIGSGVYGPANGSQVVSYRAPRMIFGGARFHFD